MDFLMSNGWASIVCLFLVGFSLLYTIYVGFSSSVDFDQNGENEE